MARAATTVGRSASRRRVEVDRHGVLRRVVAAAAVVGEVRVAGTVGPAGAPTVVGGPRDRWAASRRGRAAPRCRPGRRGRRPAAREQGGDDVGVARGSVRRAGGDQCAGGWKLIGAAVRFSARRGPASAAHGPGARPGTPRSARSPPSATAAGTSRVAAQRPSSSAPSSSNVAGAGRAEPAGRHRSQTAPPVAGENAWCGPTTPQRAQWLKDGAYPAIARARRK